MNAARMISARSSYARSAGSISRSQRTFTALSVPSHVYILSGRGRIETPAASASAPASTASARAALDELGHERSGESFPRYPICIDEPNETLFMQRITVMRSSGPAARRSAKKRLTRLAGTRLRIETSPCCSAVQPSAYTRNRYPARFVEPESRISASPAVAGTRKYAGGGAGDPDGSGLGPDVRTAEAMPPVPPQALAPPPRTLCPAPAADARVWAEVLEALDAVSPIVEDAGLG